jgi:hypothetical protein
MASEDQGADRPQPELFLMWPGSRPGRQWLLTGDRMTIGNDPLSDICVPDPSVSPRHAFLLRDDRVWSIIDARSRNGTFVNGRRVRSADIGPRDQVEVGGVTLIVGRADSRPAKAGMFAPQWWSPARWWNRVTKAVLGAGTLASAIAAVFSLFAPHPTVNSARFTSVQLIDREPLNEYQQRLSAFTSSVSDEPSAVPGEDTTGPAMVPSGSAGPAAPSAVTSAPAGETTTPAGIGSPSPYVSPTGTPAVSSSPSQPTTGVKTSPSASRPDYALFVQEKTNEDCLPAPYCQQFMDGAGADGPGRLVPPTVAAQRVTAILHQTQTTTRTTGHKPEPLGEVISVNVELTGLRGQAVYLGWSIYPANGRTSLYGKWLNRFIAYRLEATTDDDTGTAELWVPLPKAAGSYFVRITLITREAELASDDSGSFG